MNTNKQRHLENYVR